MTRLPCGRMNKPYLGAMTAEQRARHLGQTDMPTHLFDAAYTVGPQLGEIVEAIRDAEHHARAAMKEEAAKMAEELSENPGVGTAIRSLP